MFRRTLPLAVTLLASCATCRNHPIACTAGVIFVTGAITAATAHDPSHPISGRCGGQPYACVTR